MFEDATFAEILDDLASRFIINVPEEELQEIERICFQIEQAHWFYEDFIREENRALPSMTLKTFAGRMFKHCPLLSQWANNPNEAYQTFLEYKFKVPVCGAIILNPMLDKVLLVKGWSSRSSWGFPRGKINKDEPEWQCAQREVIEETGYDILPYLIEQDRIEITQADQKVLLYIIAGIPESTEFEPTTRKEISQVQWHYIDDLPCGGRADRRNGSNGMAARSEKEHRYYLIKPFVKRIKTWVSRHPERVGICATVVNPQGQPPPAAPVSQSSPGIEQQIQLQPNGNGAGRLVGSGAMSVQELFQTVNRAKSPHANTSSVPAYTQPAAPSMAFPTASTPQPYMQPAMAAAASTGPSSTTASLLQTLMAGPSAASAASGPEAVQAGGNDKLAALANLMRQTGIAATPPPPQQYQQPQLQQTAVGSGFVGQQSPPTQNYGGNSSRPGSAIIGNSAAGSSLRGFAFDTRSIMNAFTDSNI